MIQNYKSDDIGEFAAIDFSLLFSGESIYILQFSCLIFLSPIHERLIVFHWMVFKPFFRRRLIEVKLFVMEF